MINNSSLLNEIKLWPENSVVEMISFLTNSYTSINSLYDIPGFPNSIKDISYLEEAKKEMEWLSKRHYDKYHMLAFNAKFSLIGKFELIFFKNKIVQSGLQFIFNNEYFQSYLDIFNSCKSIIEHNFLIDDIALDDAHAQMNLPIPLRSIIKYSFGFYDIPPEKPKDIVNFVKEIFKLSEPEQKKATVEFLMRKLANGENLAIDDLRFHNTIQGYMSLGSFASPAYDRISSLNIKIVEMEWCNAVFPFRM